MKAILVLAFLFAAQGAMARSLAPLVCKKSQVGNDDFKQVTLFRGSVVIDRHESRIQVGPADTARAPHSIAILNKTLTMSAEGETYTIKVNALIVYNPAKNEATVTLIQDGEVAIAAEVLKCGR